MFLRCVKLHYWPWIACSWFLLSFIITYIASVLLDHVHPILPFLSDTGSLPPESCIFGQMMNIGALLLATVMYIRYRQVKFAIDSKHIVLPKRWNRLAAVFGITSCCGVSIVGNFQETSIMAVHLFGAFMAFGIGALYLIAQTRITFAFRHVYKNFPEFWVGPKILYLRTSITCCFCILYLVVSTGTSLALIKFKGTSVVYWPEGQFGYEEHLMAAIAEWILVAVFFIYLLSFVKEFRSLEYEEVRFKSKCVHSTCLTQEVA